MARPRYTLPIGRTRRILFWERLYAALVPPLAVIAAFIGLSLIGAWQVVPGTVHLAVLIISAIAAFILLYRGLGPMRFPTREDALIRLEDDGHLTAGALRDLDDEPFSGSTDDPFWQAHLDRLAQQTAHVRPAQPRALIDRIDPYSLRVGAVMLLILGVVLAGSNWSTRLADSLHPRFGKQVPLIADVWIEPPDYTRLPPQFLVRGDDLPPGTADQANVPRGSVLKVRLSQADGSRPRASAGLSTENKNETATLEEAEGALTLTAPLDEHVALTLRSGRNTTIWPIGIIPDRAPSVEWRDAPGVEGATRTALAITVDDDYGVADAAVVLRLSGENRRAPDAPQPDRTARRQALRVDVPALRGAAGDREVTIDLTEHPWAGLSVDMSVEVTDGAGQTARTAPLTFTLPERTFYNPLAKAVIEERRSLALAPQSWRRTARLFDALTFAPDRFAADTREYLLLRTAYHEVFKGQGDNTDSVVETFWPLAIALEDEGLTLARQRLEQAQAALRDALARGASQDEIDRLIEELRQAMNDYVAALAASGDANAPESGGGESMSERALDDILDEIARLRRQGDTEEARQRLAELERLLQNLQISQGGGQGQEGQSGASGQGGGQAGGQGSGEGGDGPGGPLDDAGELIDRQRRLSDDTFGAGRGSRSGQGLSGEQRDLAQQADDLAQQSGGQGDGAGEVPSASSAFDQAADAMRAAAGAIDRGDYTGAEALQEQAIAALREGASALAAQRMSERGDGEDPNASGSPGQNGSMSGRGADRDPLGRVYGQQGDTGVTIPDMADPDRIRELTQQLRERLSDPGLSAEERRYLEGLLRRF
ncbi:DUF4175 domain-containing protein [Parvularcula sp. LCG005]|uniref:DUF4175 domain-containing protein n=1 Tax=Parvularcula sp. LCG005 TaxID=3078805 RepID=UPI002942CE80|nr:DUF4175 family protein [Parvularcula sp. LCG005]WOI53646.1 DUF4175 family protein [Parvularcula sp. LCG005]